VTASMDHASIGPFLVDQPFHQMRQDGGGDHAQHQVIGLLALTTLAARARGQPKARRDHIQHMFVGGPGQEPSRTLNRRAGIANNGLSNPPVELRCAEMPTDYIQSLLAPDEAPGVKLTERKKPRRWCVPHALCYLSPRASIMLKPGLSFAAC
jgi:hypothetical protein